MLNDSDKEFINQLIQDNLEFQHDAIEHVLENIEGMQAETNYRLDRINYTLEYMLHKLLDVEYKKDEEPITCEHESDEKIYPTDSIANTQLRCRRCKSFYD